MLDDPEYIQFLVNPELKKLAIKRGTVEDIAPQKIYWTTLKDKKQCCEFYSKDFVSRLRYLVKLENGYFTYKMTGYMNDERDRVFFDLSSSEPINEEVEAEDMSNANSQV